MSLLDTIRQKYAVYCPKCETELNWYATRSDSSIIFKCILCKEFYIRTGSSSNLVETEIGHKIHDELKNIEFQEKYNGSRSSEVFGPKWMKMLNRFEKK